MAEQTQNTGREIDVVSLKALAHPLRVQLYDRLSVYGPDTASGLAARLGESSGATSYHLRQLAKHGFVREVEGRGSGRERWWERVPGSVSIPARGYRSGPSERAAGDMVAREWERRRSVLLSDFVAHGADELPEGWVEASRIDTSNLRLTLDQLREVTADIVAVLDPIIERYRGRSDPGSRPVQIHFNSFPVLDGEVVAPGDQDHEPTTTERG